MDIGKTFQQLREERAGLVKQWQDTVLTLKQRDSDIDKRNMDIDATQEILEQQQEALEEQNSFLSNEINNNKEVEILIEDLNVTSSRMRRKRNEVADEVLTMQSEVELL